MMAKCLLHCCGEGEEEYKYGNFVDAELAKELGWDTPSTSVTYSRISSDLPEEKLAEIEDTSADDPKKIQQLEKQIYRINRYRTTIDSTTETPTQKSDHRGTVFGRHYSVDCDSYRAPNFPKTSEQQNFLLEALQDDFLFQNLDDDEQTQFIKAMRNEQIKAGTQLSQQGDLSDFFCVVESGTIEFVDSGKVVGTCSAGESFGDLALILDAEQTVSSVAKTNVSMWKVDQRTFHEMLANHDRINQKKAKDWLSRVSLFQNMTHTTIGRMTKSVIPVKWPAGSPIFRKGEEALVFYIIQSGTVRLHDMGLGDSASEDNILTSGDFLGERSLLLGQLRLANATAVTDVVAFAMDKTAIEASIGGKLKNILILEMRKRSLMCLPIFANSNISESEFDMLVGCMREESYPKSHQFAKVGEPCDSHLWLIRQGRIIVYSETTDQLYNLESGDYFGDENIKMGAIVSSETVTCEENVTVDVLSRDDIEEVIGDMERLGRASKLSRSKEKATISLQNLRKHRILGRGGFGSVWLVSHPKEDDSEERDVYALKVISKVRIIDTKLTKAVIREKELLCLLDHPFILNLVHSYQDEDNLYLLLPFIPGGELYDVFEREKTSDRGMKSTHAAFYCACIIEALAHFHQRWIAYRDLKLENVAIDSEGYGVLVDLGFAKVVTDRTYTLVGTPEMLAPEVILSKGHDVAVDYWAFGVICFELLVGHSPFYDKGASQMDVFKRIVRLDYDFPDFLEDSAKDLIRRLLVRHPSKRLGNLSNGYLDIKRHPWFAESGIKFKRIRRKEFKAPWIPDMKDPLGFSLLQKVVHSMDFNEAPCRRLSRSEQELFQGFLLKMMRFLLGTWYNQQDFACTMRSDCQQVIPIGRKPHFKSNSAKLIVQNAKAILSKEAGNE